MWDYPRPPALEPTSRRIRVMVGGVLVADSRSTVRVLETSHPPAYYVPPADVRTDVVAPVMERQSVCEWKGVAAYWSITTEHVHVTEAAWSYPEPNPDYREIKDHLCFYAARVDGAWVDDERVVPQPSDFYGGWITSDIVGPFKGGPGTWGW